ncbi:MAG: DUF805 domain-containing protein [Methylococcales bacterium]
MKKYLIPTGRLSRLDYWKFTGVMYAVLFALGGIANALDATEAAEPVFMAIIIPFIVVGFIVQIKRWHDRNKTGWWVLINLIPLLGAIWSLIELGFFKGTVGANNYGEDPVIDHNISSKIV